MIVRNGGRRWSAVAGSLLGMALLTAGVGHADPAASPYPDAVHLASTYDRVAAEDYVVAGQPGVWFLSPSGLNCVIFDKGGFGCRGDIPGAPPGANTIGWYNGQILVRYDLLAAILFPPGLAQRALPVRTSLSFNGTTCSILPDTSTYCERGGFRFLVAPTQTWLN